MTVKVETDTAQVATYFTGLQDASTTGVKINFFKKEKYLKQNEYLEDMDDDRSQLDMTTTQQSTLSSTDSLDTAEVRLDIKKFAQLLHSQQPHAEKMTFSMSKKKEEEYP